MIDHDNCSKRAEYHYDIEPNIVCYNPLNEKKHQAFWRLKDPVHCQPDARSRKPYRYLKAIESAYDEKYNADVNFSRHIHRNPLYLLTDTDWRHDRAYSLSELAEVVDMQQRIIRSGSRLPTDSGSRNVTLFNDLRAWAYPLALAAQKFEYEDWYKQVVTRAISFNAFSNPLGLAEVLTTAKSVAEFSYFMYRRNQDIVITDEFRALQARRGAVGGKVSKGGGRRSVIDAESAQRIELMLTMHYTQKEIAEMLGVGLNTVKRHIAATMNVK